MQSLVQFGSKQGNERAIRGRKISLICSFMTKKTLQIFEKFYNLGNKRFETGFSSVCLVFVAEQLNIMTGFI